MRKHQKGKKGKWKKWNLRTWKGCKWYRRSTIGGMGNIWKLGKVFSKKKVGEHQSEKSVKVKAVNVKKTGIGKSAS